MKGTELAVLRAVYDLMLVTMNPFQGPKGSPVPITGEFGPASRSAVIHIQDDFGLTTDGELGPHTFFHFGAGVGPFTTYGGPAYGSRRLAPGAAGGDATRLRNRLSTFRHGSLLGHAADGDGDDPARTACAHRAPRAGGGARSFATGRWPGARRSGARAGVMRPGETRPGRDRSLHRRRPGSWTHPAVHESRIR